MAPTTELCYLTIPDSPEMAAQLLVIDTDGDQQVLILDRTPFYPQGGGQPSDVGFITGAGFVFQVRRARLDSAGVVLHCGSASTGIATLGPVMASIDSAYRKRNTRLHSGGHLIMTATYELTGLHATKGYHFPDGAYVEFEGILDDAYRDSVSHDLQPRIEEMLAADAPVSITNVSKQELDPLDVVIPASIPPEKPTRLVTTFGYDSPCGGTHVARTGELQGLHVRAIKTKSGRTRVSYGLNDIETRTTG
jgi:Ser-tRNA(Ala) deacylase AlaX